MVAAVSMKTAENRNIARFAGSWGAVRSAKRPTPKRPR